MGYLADLRLKKFRIPVLICFLFLAAAGETDALGPRAADQIAEALSKRLVSFNGSRRLLCMGERLCGSVVLPRFYGLREFSPFWVTDKGVGPQTDELIRAIREAGNDGLNPRDYHLRTLEELLAEIRSSGPGPYGIPIQKWVDLELLLSDAFFLYASHLTSGRVSPETLLSQWAIKTRDVDLVRLLLPSQDKGDFAHVLEAVNQQGADYQRLKKAFNRYGKIAEKTGWPYIPAGPVMKKGDRGARVIRLRSRLSISGDLIQSVVKDPENFEAPLEKAVLRFQRRHGLKEDGIVGRETLSALNIKASDRLNQLLVNMERRRWLQRELGSRYLVVNIADFKLRVLEDNASILSMRVVVGKDYRRTPVFEGKMTYLVINPFWRIPHKLAMEDFLPLLRKDPKVIRDKKIRIYESWADGSQEIDPETVDWKRLSRRDFGYKLVQEPGPWNALGRVKFIFPNKFSVYLHDTPARHLFDMTKRDFSSGCIRIENPVELAAYLLQGDNGWTRQKIQDAIKRRDTQIVRLPDPIAVKILYFTAWVDQRGLVHFRDDIYRRDYRLAQALREKPPS